MPTITIEFDRIGRHRTTVEEPLRLTLTSPFVTVADWVAEQVDDYCAKFLVSADHYTIVDLDTGVVLINDGRFGVGKVIRTGDAE